MRPIVALLALATAACSVGSSGHLTPLPDGGTRGTSDGTGGTTGGTGGTTGWATTGGTTGNSAGNCGTPSVQVEPLWMNFGHVIVHSTVSKTLTITNTSSCTITLNALAPAGPSASLFSVPAEYSASTTPIPPGGVVQFPLSFSPTQLSSAEETANLVVTYGSGASVEVDLEGFGVYGGLCVNPTSGPLRFGNVRLGQSVTKLITVGNCANEPFKLYHAWIQDSAGEAFTIGPCPPMANCQPVYAGDNPYTLNPGDQLTYPITFTPSQGQGYEGSFGIMDDHGVVWNIALLGGGGGPEITCQTVPPTPPPIALMLDFGPVVVPDGGAVQSIICTNTGNDVTIQGMIDPSNELQVAQSGITITQPAGSFSAQLTLAGLDTTEVSLRAGEQFAVQVTYDPAAATPAGQIEMGTLQIQSNATLNPTVFVSLTGDAVAPQ
jgi:hypothetical protein